MLRRFAYLLDDSKIFFLIISALLSLPSYSHGGSLPEDGAKGQNVTQASQEIPHPTTGWAQVELIAEIGRDRMFCDCFERSCMGRFRRC